MYKGWIILVMFFFIMTILSGCNQVEDILSKVNQLLDNQLENNESSDEDEAEVEEETAEKNPNDMADDTDMESEQAVDDKEANNPIEKEQGNQSFLEKLSADGYESVVLPNGFPIRIPYYWILVEENTAQVDGDQFVGIFCYDIPMQTEDVAHLFDAFNDVSHEKNAEDRLTTTFNDLVGKDAMIEYFTDEHGNDCAEMVIDYGDDSMSFYGEDPSTMISEEELAASKEAENVRGVTEDRQRHLPDNYEEVLAELQDLKAEGFESVNNKIYNLTFDLQAFIFGLPEIFPYEWYLLEEEDYPKSSSWSGNFCTDAPAGQTLIHHLNMLENYNADIEEVKIMDNPDMPDIAWVVFELNDEYGTGSWTGTTGMFLIESGNLDQHQCARVEMTFSPEVLQ